MSGTPEGRIGIIQKQKGWMKENRIPLLAFLLCAGVWLLLSIIMKYAPLGNNSLLMNDAIHQYYPLFGQYRQRLLSGEGIAYSAGGGMGFNFYALWTYYLSAPLNLLILFFPPAHIDAGMNLLIMLKVALSAFTFAWYLKKRKGVGDMAMIPFALGYAMSTFVLGYGYNIMWMDGLFLFPIVLAGLEELIKKGKWRLYTFSLALTLWCNFYFAFMVCLFCVLWFLLYKFDSLKQFIRRGVQFAGCSFLGAGLSAIVLVPAYMGIVQTQGGLSLPASEWMGPFSEIFAGKEGGIFLFSDPISINNEFSYNANLYCGIFVLGLVVLYFFARDIGWLEKVKMAYLLGIFVLSMNNELLNYIWHGFHYQVGIPNRFVFLLLFVLLLMAYQAFVRIQKYRYWEIALSFVGVAVVYTFLFFLQREYVSIRMLSCTLVAVFLYGILQLLWRSEKSGDTFFRKLLIGLMCMELCANAIVGSRTQTGVVADDFYRCKEDMQKVSNEFLYDQYRTELSNPTVKNEGLTYNLRGLGIFSSMVNINTANTLKKIGFSTTSNSYSLDGSTPVLDTLFGVKNYLIVSEDVNRLDPDYKLTDSVGEVDVYENEKVLPVAYLCKEEVEDWSELQEDFLANQERLLEKMSGGDYAIFQKQEYTLHETNDIEVDSLDEDTQWGYLSAQGKRDDHVVFETTVKEDTQDLYLVLRASRSDKTTVAINDQVIAYKDLSSSFYHVGEVKRGDKVTVSFGIQENSETFGRIALAMYSYNREELEKFTEDMKDSLMDVTHWEEGRIEGTVNVAGNRHTLFTTIPYERGWDIYVDGEKVETSTIHGAFLALELEDGKHTIVMEYKVPGFLTGMVLSLVSLLVLLFLLYMRHRGIQISAISLPKRRNLQRRDVNEESTK